MIVKSRINEDDDYSSFPHGQKRTFQIERQQYPNCMLEKLIPDHSREFVKRVFFDGEQLLGWDIKIRRDPSNSFTCCSSMIRDPGPLLRLAEIQCHPGSIESLIVDPFNAKNCGLEKILVRLCMNADYNGQSQHARDANANRAMEYIRNRIPINYPPLKDAYDMLRQQAESTCGRILMVPMEIAYGPGSEEWIELPRIFFDSAKYAMYDSIAYEYTDVDDLGNKFTFIDPSFEYTHFASLAAQADSFRYGENEAEFARGEGRVIRKRVVGDKARWYICSTP